jgi:plasmid stabilization system protein ParE
VDKIRRAASRLEAFPLSGRVVPEFRIDALRELIVDGYRIVYTVEQGDVEILVVTHGSRDIFSQF